MEFEVRGVTVWYITDDVSLFPKMPHAINLTVPVNYGPDISVNSTEAKVEKNGTKQELHVYMEITLTEKGITTQYIISFAAHLDVPRVSIADQSHIKTSRD